MTEEILIKFLLIITVLFFVPKVLYRIKRVPYPLTEVALGIALGILLPTYFFVDDIVNLLAALGIITIFISAGMEIDERFISKNKRIIAENMIIQFVLVFAIAVIITTVFSLSFQVGLIMSLALLIPSTSFIFSYLKRIYSF